MTIIFEMSFSVLLIKLEQIILQKHTYRVSLYYNLRIDYNYY